MVKISPPPPPRRTLPEWESGTEELNVGRYRKQFGMLETFAIWDKLENGYRYLPPLANVAQVWKTINIAFLYSVPPPPPPRRTLPGRVRGWIKNLYAFGSDYEAEKLK